MSIYIYDILCAIACLLFLDLASANCLHGTSLHSSSGNTSWGYTNGISPLLWASLDPSFASCASSKYQSPINLDCSIPRAQSPPQVGLSLLSTPQLLNTGVSIEVVPNVLNASFGRGPITMFDGSAYRLAQFHFHVPSEHRVEEEFFAAEMHMVHENTRLLQSQSRAYNREFIFVSGLDSFVRIDVHRFFESSIPRRYC